MESLRFKIAGIKLSYDNFLQNSLEQGLTFSRLSI